MKILNNKIVMLILMLAFFKPGCIQYLFAGTMVEDLYDGYRLLSIMIILAIWFFNAHHEFDECNLFLFCSIYHIFTVLISVIIKSNLIFNRITTFLSVMGLIILVYMCIKVNLRSFIEVSFVLVSVYISINAILLIIFPRGFNNAIDDAARVNFLGKDNVITTFFLLALVVGMLYCDIVKNILPMYFLYAMIIVTTIYLASGTGIII